MSEQSALTDGWRRAWRSCWLASALVVPALCLGQAANPSASAPGMPAGELPGAQLPTPGPSFSSLVSAAESLPLAQYANYGVALGVGATDNVSLSAQHPKSQALAGASLFLDLLHKASRLEVVASGDFSDINYLEHAYSNQVLGRFDGLADATLWQHHLKWLVRDDYGDQQVNPLESFTPNNLERVNIFSTGPSLTLRPTLTSFINLRGLYSRTSYQTSPFDAQSGAALAALGHNLSAASKISVNASAEKLKFDNNNVNRGYELRAYYGRYSLQGARTTIDLQAGVNQVNDLGPWKSSPLVRLTLTRNVSAYSTVTLAGGREYTNAMSQFAGLGSGTGGGIPVGAAVGTTSSGQHTFGTAGWEFHRLRTSIGLSGGWDRLKYDTNAGYSATRENVAFNLGRKLTPILSANILATYNRSDYFEQGFTDKFATVGAGVVYRPGRWFVIYGRYDHEFRRPGGGLARGLAYDENRLFIMIGYYPHSSGTSIPGMSGGMPMAPGM